MDTVVIDMYVGVILYKFKPETIDQALKTWKDMILPEAKKQKGFVKADMFADRQSGRAMDIGYWQTDEDAENFEKSGAYGFLLESLKDHLEVKPQRLKFQKMED